MVRDVPKRICLPQAGKKWLGTGQELRRVVRRSWGTSRDFFSSLAHRIGHQNFAVPITIVFARMTLCQIHHVILHHRGFTAQDRFKLLFDFAVVAPSSG
jgi:hypothetical protein